jgi:asparagine synthase (glutamine-hydrolysing)
MCGIAGLFYSDMQRSVDEPRLAAMRDAMVHRGPDDAGLHVDGPLGLAHRRLSIIDLGSGHQPMSTQDGRYTIVFNGEIYNYRELRKELTAAGCAFHTASDTEVILQMHARCGVGAVQRLNGIFAYAIWDAVERRLTVARDRMGIKPLYYAHTAEGLVFASEIKALFESGLIAPAVNKAAVPEYLMFRQVAGEENLFDGVLTLLPGHYMEVDRAGARFVRYWSVEQAHSRNTLSYGQAVDGLDTVLREAVERQMMSDVPLGTFCSGGIDSSLVTAIAARASGRAINTFSVGFHEADFDETRYARMVASRYGTDHHEIKLDANQFAERLPGLVWQNDLPLNFPNSVQIFAVSELAKQTVTVVLTGEGADELFGGYPRYYIPRLLGYLSWLPLPLRRAALSVLAPIRDHRVQKLRLYAGQSESELLVRNPTATDPELVRALCSAPPDMDYRRACVSAGQALGLSGVDNLMHLDLRTYLVSILNRQDKMSMAASVEARVPFLDNEVVDFALGLPLSYKQTARQRKRVLMSVARRYLPDAVVDRRKSGFGVPLDAWMRGDGPLAEQVASLPSDPGVEEFFNRDTLAGLVKRHRAGADHSDLLWSVLNFAQWRRQFGM